MMIKEDICVIMLACLSLKVNILIISKIEANKESVYLLKTRFVDIHMYVCVQMQIVAWTNGQTIWVDVLQLLILNNRICEG